MEWMFMPLKRYADFSGRSRRMEFWMWQLLQIIIYFVVIMLVMMAGGGAMMAGDPSALAAAGGGIMIVMMLYGLYCLAIIIPSIAVAVRRLHDTNRSGWWVLAPIGPYLLAFVLGLMMIGASPDSIGMVGVFVMICMLAAFVLAVVLFIFYVLEGTKGPNQYGPDPKAPDAGQVFS